MTTLPVLPQQLALTAPGLKSDKPAERFHALTMAMIDQIVSQMSNPKRFMVQQFLKNVVFDDLEKLKEAPGETVKKVAREMRALSVLIYTIVEEGTQNQETVEALQKYMQELGQSETAITPEN